ncbi:hypothetical protein Tsubulata_037750, partial [Turnera subulata]
EFLEAANDSGIILICYGGQLKEEGIDLLFARKSLHSRLVECRKDAKEIISSIYTNNYIESARVNRRRQPAIPMEEEEVLNGTWMII